MNNTSLKTGLQNRVNEERKLVFTPALYPSALMTWQDGRRGQGDEFLSSEEFRDFSAFQGLIPQLCSSGQKEPDYLSHKCQLGTSGSSFNTNEPSCALCERCCRRKEVWVRSHLKGEFQARTSHLLCYTTSAIPSAVALKPAQAAHLTCRVHSSAGSRPLWFWGMYGWSCAGLNFKGKCTHVTHSLIQRIESEAQVLAFQLVSRGCSYAWSRDRNPGTVGLKHKHLITV